MEMLLSHFMIFFAEGECNNKQIYTNSKIENPSYLGKISEEINQANGGKYIIN